MGGAYVYRLDSSQLRALEGEVEALVAGGYTWTSLYTQCTLANVLLAVRSPTHTYDPTLCLTRRQQQQQQWLAQQQEQEEELTEEALALLRGYIDEYYALTGAPQSHQPQDEELRADYEDYALYNDVGASEGALPPAEKKDEFVAVHKYLKSHKRDPLYSSSGEDAGAPDGTGAAVYQNLLRKLSTQDLELLADYLDIGKDDSENKIKSGEMASEDVLYPDYAAAYNEGSMDEGSMGGAGLVEGSDYGGDRNTDAMDAARAELADDDDWAEEPEGR